jgi:hypothetical protein
MKLKTVFLFFFLFLPLLFSSSLSDIETSINKGSDSSYSSSTDNNNYHVEEKGGFEENTTIVGVEELLDNTRFSANDFKGWMSLYYQSKMIETFMSLYKNQHIDSQGIALETLQYGDIKFPQGTVVLPSKLTGHYKKEFTKTDLLDVLIDENVLDVEGFLVDFPTFTNKFYDADFSFVLEKLQGVDLDISIDKLDLDLKQQLYELLISQQKVKKITSVTTTDYVSREDDFLSQLAMQFAGSFVGDVLFKDKTKVSKQKVNWVPHLQPSKYLTGFYIGFNDYPFAYDSGSRWLWNGSLKQRVIDFDYLEYEDVSQYLISAKKQYLFGSKDILGNFSTGHAYGQVYTRNHLLQDGSNSLNFYSLGIGLGGAVTYKNNIDFGIGIAVQDGEDLSVGLTTFLGWEWFVFDPVSISVLGALYEQPKEAATNWSFSEQEVTLKFHLPHLALRTGYRRLGAGGSTLTNSLFFGCTATY